MQITNEDNMVLMARYPDKYFDLAIVDPPYGLNISALSNYGESGGTDKRWNTNKKDFYKPKEWDKNIPTAEYWEQLFRVSKNQIVWGWNYYVSYFNDCPSYIVWNKEASGNYSDCEMAWCSIKGTNKIFKWLWNGFRKQQPEERIHPTQKPIALYKWLLDKYAKQGDKILDTHLGSGSIAIACYDLCFDLTACELDTDYFNAAMKRIAEHKKQIKLF